MKKYSPFIYLLLISLSISLFLNFHFYNLKNRIAFTPGSVESMPELGTAIVYGYWIPQDYSSYIFFSPNDIIATDLICYKATLKCSEDRSLLLYSELLGGLKNYYMFPYHFDYEISKWTEEYINARMVGDGRVFDLIINFTNETASLVVYDNPSNSTASAGTQTSILGN